MAVSKMQALLRVVAAARRHQQPPPPGQRLSAGHMQAGVRIAAFGGAGYAVQLVGVQRIVDGALVDVPASAWAGLGYYSRARNLLKCARAVAERGGFPSTEAELRALPGLGDYTAAAIAAIAFGRRAVVVDANVERVGARLFAITEPLPGARKAIRAATATITPEHRADDFAQAMMDLGSHVCTTRAPRCLLCPLAGGCEGRKAGEPERLPVKPPKRQVPERRGTAFWITRARGTQVWLVTRPAQGMLGGMRALPDDGWSAQGDGSGKVPLAGEWRKLGAVRHGFTHAHLTLEVQALETLSQPRGAGQWWPVENIGEAGLATLFAKAARLALASAD
jgi:A/G-specific adenine glycosylase